MGHQFLNPWQGVGHSIFSYLLGVGHPVIFFNGDWHAFDNKGNFFQTIEASDTLKHQPGIGSHGQLFLPY